MTIHLPEDLESYIHAKVLSGQFETEDAAVAEAVRRFKQSEMEQQQQAVSANVPSQADRKPIWERAAELRESIPAEEWAKLPVDGASRHDHHIYGTPKRPTQ